MPDTEIHRFAEEHGVDLIVVGSHGRHGFALLLGSTSTGVLHGAQCDVLAVRVGKKGEKATSKLHPTMSNKATRANKATIANEKAPYGAFYRYGVLFPCRQCL
ncbi:hypothetical protein HSBAA_40640 [Vreelandella sulfidaeris]|uniref:UspA domain-containing protein n=1 Tax=Vreelandella sulfidaeris TaxID=115553 RepID=A0A455UEQ7_9GAMM|nr:hypothetical protein HSBAA_40640 [Halomonas sulfidaeris]